MSKEVEGHEQIPLNELEEGMVVRTKRWAVYNENSIPPGATRGGWVFGRLQSTTPDADNDVKVELTSPDGRFDGSFNYFDARHLYRVPYDGPFANLREDPDPVLADVLGDEDDDPSFDGSDDADADDSDEDDETDVLDTLEEDQETLVQMQQLRACTVGEGILKLPVSSIASAANSQQWAIDVEHPVLDDLRFFRKKPVTGWTDDYDIVGLLESYGIFNGNPYELQTREVYVEHQGGDPENSNNWALKRYDDVDERLPSEMQADDDDEDESGDSPPGTRRPLETAEWSDVPVLPDIAVFFTATVAGALASTVTGIMLELGGFPVPWWVLAVIGFVMFGVVGGELTKMRSDEPIARFGGGDE